MPRGMGRGRGAVEKPKDFGGVMKKLVKFCSRYIPVMIFALVLGAAGTVCQIIGPDKLKDMTNEITKGLPAMVHGKPVMNSIDMDAVSRIAWLLVALYVGYALLSYLQSWLMANVTQRTAQQLREAISQKINRLPLKYFDKVSYGDVLSRITNDVDAIGQTLGQSVGSLITSVTLFFGALIMMFYNNVTMTLCAIGSALLGLIIMGVIMKVSQKYFTRQQVALGDVNGHVEEMYTGHTVVKAYCGEERSIEQFEKYNNDLYVSGWKSQFLSGLMMPIMNFVGNFGYVVVCVVGAALAMDGKIEFGVIVAFMMYIRLFTQPLSQFAQAFQNLQRCAAASERVFGFLDEPELADETGKQALLGVGADGKPQPVRGDVEFSHVRFGYDADKTIINDFSASVKAGQKVAIVGPTGAGKTTMVNLLMRFYEISGGTISIDGIDTKSVPRWNVHDQFSMVLQDTWVFRGTVRENIAYSKKDVTDEQAMEIALVENLQREDLDPVEEAMGIRELMTRCDLTQEQAARKLGKSRSALANSLRLLNLPETVLELLKGGFLTTGHAKVVLGLPTPELQEQAAQIIADHELNVRQAEALCKKLAKPPKEPVEPAPRGTLPVEVEESLKQALGSEVNVAYHDGKGKLTVHFYSDEQLKAFANLLGQYQVED